MKTALKPKPRTTQQPDRVTRLDHPYTLNMPDGRIVYFEIPGHMTVTMDGEVCFLPPAMKLIDSIRAMALKIEGTPRPAHIAALRAAMNMTQEKLAKMLGLNKLTISRWECGTLKPGAAQVKKLAKLQARAAAKGVVLS